MNSDNAPQPDTQYVIAALYDEVRSLNENKLYLHALIKQVQAEFVEAKEAWDAERESLKKAVGDA